MNTYRSYTERISSLTPTVLGFRLMPFSLGMSINLKEARSKFITGEYNGFLDINNIFTCFTSNAASLINEFIFAVLCCSNTFDEFKEECGSGGILNTIQTLLKELKKQPVNWLYEIHTFAHYLHKATTSLPDYNIKQNDSNKFNPVDYEESIKDCLMTNTTYTRNECYNNEWAEINSAYLLQMHKHDVIEFVSEEMVQLQKQMKGIK